MCVYTNGCCSIIKLQIWNRRGLNICFCSIWCVPGEDGPSFYNWTRKLQISVFQRIALQPLHLRGKCIIQYLQKKLLITVIINIQSDHITVITADDLPQERNKIHYTILGSPFCLQETLRRSVQKQQSKYQSRTSFTIQELLFSSLFFFYLSCSIPESAASSDEYLTRENLVQVGYRVDKLWTQHVHSFTNLGFTIFFLCFLQNPLEYRVPISLQLRWPFCKL